MQSEVLQLKQIAEKLSRLFGNHNRVRRRDALQACCNVRRFADYAAFLRLARAD
jgi:hypothetical protein